MKSVESSFGIKSWVNKFKKKSRLILLMIRHTEWMRKMECVALEILYSIKWCILHILVNLLNHSPHNGKIVWVVWYCAILNLAVGRFDRQTDSCILHFTMFFSLLKISEDFIFGVASPFFNPHANDYHFCATNMFWLSKCVKHIILNS